MYTENFAASLVGPVPGTEEVVRELRTLGVRLYGLTNWSAEMFHEAEPAAPAIGLITKTETNPYFVKMKEGAEAAARAGGARLLTGAGRNDGDNAGQVTALENMVAAGAKTILITPSDSKAIVPAIARARAAGVMVIALDSPTEPASAVDALFATDNYKAGILIGQWARKSMGNKKAVIAALDLFPGHPVGIARGHRAHIHRELRGKLQQHPRRDGPVVVLHLAEIGQRHAQPVGEDPLRQPVAVARLAQRGAGVDLVAGHCALLNRVANQL